MNRSRVLILEDDIGIALLQRRQLERAGYEVITSSTPEEAFAALREQDTDVILVDYRLQGDVTGLGFCANLRASGSDVPIVMVSGSATEAGLIDALRAGVSDYVQKDQAMLDRLPEVVGRVLERARIESQAGMGFRQSHFRPGLGPILIVEDDPTHRLQISRQLERAGYRTTAARTEAEIVDIVDRESVALILLDQNLSETTGLELYRRLMDSGHRIPAVLVTGYGDMTTAAQAMRAGIREYVEKTPDFAASLPAVVQRVFERVRYERQIDESRARLAAIVSSAMDAIISVDERGTITLFNHAAEGIFNTISSKALGGPISQFVPQLSEVVANRTSENPGVTSYETRGCRDGGGEIVLEMSVAESTAAGQRFYTIIARDITARKQTEAQLKATNESLSRAVADLEQFAYISSHDLQEPLRMMTIFTQRLERALKGSIDPDVQESTRHIISSAQRMSTLVSDALQYARVSSDRRQISTRHSMEDILSDVLHELSGMIHETGATITHDPLPQVLAEPAQLTVVFRNLLTNALKYRSEAEPIIHIGVAEQDGEWLFSVRDNGVGFDPQYAHQIFQVFKRLHGREVPGTGIGLALCKRIVENHGGRIWAYSRIGQGATFYFTLPQTSSRTISQPA